MDGRLCHIVRIVVCRVAIGDINIIENYTVGRILRHGKSSSIHRPDYPRQGGLGTPETSFQKATEITRRQYFVASL